MRELRWSGGFLCSFLVVLAACDDGTSAGTTPVDSDQTCQTGQVVTGIDARGDLLCSADQDGLGATSCADGQVLRWQASSAAWVCDDEAAVGAHNHDGADIDAGTVAEAHIDAAVARDSEIVPAVLASDGAGSTLDADLLDGFDSSAFQPANVRTLVVSPITSGSATDNGTLLLNTLASISSPGPFNPYLIKIEPGVYDVGTTPVAMREWVDIEGSGEGVTRIVGQALASSASGTVEGASNAELRWLTVENTGGSGFAIAIYNGPGTAPRITHVTAVADNASTTSFGIRSSGAEPRLAFVTARATNGGTSNRAVQNEDSDATLLHVDASASGAGATNIGIDNRVALGTSTVWIEDSSATGDDGNENRGIVTSGVTKATIVESTARASGFGADNAGVWTTNTVVELRHVASSATRGAADYGLYITGSSGISVTHSQLTGRANSVRSTGTASVNIGGSQLSGTVSVAGTPTCAGVFDQSFTFFASSCP